MQQANAEIVARIAELEEKVRQMQEEIRLLRLQSRNQGPLYSDDEKRIQKAAEEDASELRHDIP